MKPRHLDCTTISDAWFRLIYDIFDNSYIQNIQRGSFEEVDYRRQYAGVSVYIERPWEDIVPVIPPHLSIPAPTTMEYIENYFVSYLIGIEMSENETYTYGSRISEIVPEFVDHPNGGEALFTKNSKTQIEAVIAMLKETPLTNHAIIEIAKPSDITACVGKDGKNDPPCLRLIDFKVIPVQCGNVEMCKTVNPNGKTENCTLGYKCMKGYKLVLTVSVYFRSWDLWSGFPSNLGGIELMKQYVAQECGLENGAMYAYSSGLHVYGIHEKIARIRTAKNEK